MTTVGKHVVSGKCGKTCRQWRVWENMKPVDSLGKHVASGKCGKTCSYWQVWENMYMTGKSAGNMWPVKSAGKHVARETREETVISCIPFEGAA